jgi:ArsR family transcriptional regulator
VKTLESTKVDEELMIVLRALANPARFRIFQELRQRGDPCQCGPLVDALPLAQSTVSEHLKRLREAGLINGEIDGPAVNYCVNEEKLAWLKQEIAAL